MTGKTEETRPTRGNTCHAFCVSCTRSTSIPVLFSLEESFSSFRYLQSPRDNLNNLLFSSFISWTMLHQSESWSCFQRCKSDCLEKLETWGLVICAMKWDESMQRLWINGSISRFVKFNSLEHDRMWKLPFTTSFFPNNLYKYICEKYLYKGISKRRSKILSIKFLYTNLWFLFP